MCCFTIAFPPQFTEEFADGGRVMSGDTCTLPAHRGLDFHTYTVSTVPLLFITSVLEFFLSSQKAKEILTESNIPHGNCVICLYSFKVGIFISIKKTTYTYLLCLYNQCTLRFYSHNRKVRFLLRLAATIISTLTVLAATSLILRWS